VPSFFVSQQAFAPSGAEQILFAATPSRIAAFLLLVSGLFGLVLSGCSLFEDDPVTVEISGRVTNENAAPLAGAEVVAQYNGTTQTQVTGAGGTYQFEFEIPEAAEVEVTVGLQVDGTVINATSLTVTSDDPVQRDVDFVLTVEDGGDGPVVSEPSGSIARLVLSGTPSTTLRVVESGGPETVSLTFVGLDSLGRTVNGSNAATVRFRFGQNPGGDLSVSPAEGQTNARGEVTAVVSSGTRAGIVQLVAEATRPGGGIVRSDPVRLTVHGGLPDQAFFTVAPAIRNIPGLVRFSETTPIEVIAGDRFSNPVAPGTAVYFSTTHGVIGASTETTSEGLGSVILRSANPLPTTDGIAIVTAGTAGRDEERVFDQTPVVFSGPTTLQLSPGTAGFGSYTLTVADALGNPLVEGTSVIVTVSGEGVEVAGSTEVSLGDTGVTTSDANGDGLLQPSEVTVVTGRDITEFPFSITRDPESTEQSVNSITVTVTSPNGDLTTSIFPSSAATASTNGTTIPPTRTASGVQATLER
jgi:hypothetical protein